jgi:hypothetical protein
MIQVVDIFLNIKKIEIFHFFLICLSPLTPQNDAKRLNRQKIRNQRLFLLNTHQKCLQFLKN